MQIRYSGPGAQELPSGLSINDVRTWPIEVAVDDILILQIAGPTSIQVIERLLGQGLRDLDFLAVRGIAVAQLLVPADALAVHDRRRPRRGRHRGGRRVGLSRRQRLLTPIGARHRRLQDSTA
jgi:hypothetical protein